jgi:aspartyl-tRNA(Asn)/glutamyl-tRNA(Gln) amidotransferase subunit C
MDSQPPHNPTHLTDEQVRHVAKLSRLDLTDEQIHRFAGQLSAVLGYVSKLNELDVEGVEPMAHAMDVTNVTREDEPTPGMCVDDVLANAPGKSPPFFKVPKVLGEGSGA